MGMFEAKWVGLKSLKTWAKIFVQSFPLARTAQTTLFGRSLINTIHFTQPLCNPIFTPRSINKM